MKDLVSKGLLFGLGGISAILGALFMIGTISEGLIITWCYILMILATIAALGFSILTLATNIKNSKGALIGIAGILVIVAISYVIAGGDVTEKMTKLDITESTSKWSGAGLIMVYILGSTAIGAAIYSGVVKMIK